MGFENDGLTLIRAGSWDEENVGNPNSTKK